MDLRGIVWADANRSSWVWRRHWLRAQLKRQGALGVVDQILFRLIWMRNAEYVRGAARMRNELAARDPGSPVGKWPCAHLQCDALNDEVSRFAVSLRPDLIFVNCLTSLLPDRLLELPPMGSFVLHEGLTPEYRGMHTSFWPVANGDFDKVGYTLLRANRRIDAGPVYAQGVTLFDPLRTSLGYLTHATLVEGLDDIAGVLRRLAAGTARPIDTSARATGYYGYFRFSAYRRILRRRRAAGIALNLGDTVAYRALHAASANSISTSNNELPKSGAIAKTHDGDSAGTAPFASLV